MLLLEDHVLHRFAGGDHGQDVLRVRNNHVEDVRAVVVEHLLDGFAELTLLDHAAAFDAVTFGDFHEVVETEEVKPINSPYFTAVKFSVKL